MLVCINGSAYYYQAMSLKETRSQPVYIHQCADLKHRRGKLMSFGLGETCFSRKRVVGIVNYFICTVFLAL